MATFSELLSAAFIEIQKDIKKLFDTFREEYIEPALSIERTDQDVNDVFTKISFFRLDGTLYKKSVLSDGSSPKYTTRTITYYKADGVTVKRTDVFTLTYTANGYISKETLT